jgi:hypothetical protein
LEGELDHTGNGRGGVGAVIRLLMTNRRREYAHVDPTGLDRGDRFSPGLAVAVSGAKAASLDRRSGEYLHWPSLYNPLERHEILW